MTASSPEKKPSPAELGALLNQGVLQLNPEVRMTRLSTDRLVLKYQPGRQYLVVTPRQWNTLQEFKSARSVTDVLCGLISTERGPSLRELYELVVKAAQAGILQTGAWPAPGAETPVSWSLRVNGTAVRWLAGLALVAAVVSLILRHAQLPVQPVWLGLGWLAVCAAASLGTVLAAGVVRAAGGDVYRLRFDWKSPVPHLRAELGDALMGGRTVEVNTALARLAPHFVILAVVDWWMPGLLLPVLVGALLALSPLWPSPLLDLLGALYRDPHLATAYDFVLARDRLFRFLTMARQQYEDRKYLLVCAGATVVWLALVLLTGGALLHANAVQLIERFQASGGARYTALALLVLCSALVLGAAGFTGWCTFSHLRAWWRERTERRLRPSTVLVSPQTIAEWLGRSVLFRELPAEDIAAVAAAVKPEEHKRGSFVVREGEPGERLYIVLSGRLEVRRDFAPGRSEPVAEMGEGDVFGEIALLQGGPRTRSIRSLGRSVLLALDKADFERLVLSKLSRQTVADAVQKVGFLQHAELTRNWSHATLAAFARRSKLEEVPEGAVILEEGKANHSFYLVHRGELSVRVKAVELRRLKLGDSFGELSLLGNGLATASVVVSSKLASVLVISARDFLDFVSQDFVVGLGWEETRKDRKDI